MRIALCDDEQAENERLSGLIEQYAVEKSRDVRCTCFTDGRELLKEERYDLYFLDYFMAGMNGVELALALKEKFAGAVSICFLTNYENAAIEVINNRIYAEGFLKKPVDPALLYEKLDLFYRSSFDGHLSLRKGSGFETLRTRDILYAEAYGKHTRLHLFGETREYNYLLSEMESGPLSGAQFFRIHRSYLINMNHVERFDAKSVTLVGGETLPLKVKTFREVYQDFIVSRR